MPTDKLEPSKHGAPGSLNFNSYNGRANPAFKSIRLKNSDVYHYAVGVVEFKAPLSSGGQPRQYCAQAKTVYRLEDGSVTDDVTATSSTAFNDVVQGMVVWDVPDDGAPSTFTQGSHPGLIVTFGTGNPVAGQTGVQYRLLDTDSSTPWNAASDASTTYLTAWQICKAGPDLYAVCDSGRTTSLGDYHVSKCPAGSNPVLAASWFNGFEVGGPEWKITGLAAIGDSIVVAKPDGLYYYSDLTKRFENVLKHYEITPHALNGKGLASVTGGVVYPTNDGHAYFFDGVAVQDITPTKLWPELGRDIGNSRITAICDTGDSIEMFYELGYQTTQNLSGLVINTVTSGGTATAITGNCIDGSLNTGGSLTGILTGSFIDIWSPVPFEGVVMYLTRNTNANTSIVISNVSYSSANDTFTADPIGFIDGTRLAQAGTSPTGSFATTNLPPSASSGLVMGMSPNWASLQQAVTFNYTAGTDVTTAMYGMRITVTGGTMGTVAIDELELITARAGMPNKVILSSSTNFTARDRAGLIGHVVSMKRTGTIGFVPRDRYAVNCFPGVWAMAAFNGRLGQASGAQNLGPSLILWGRYTVYGISQSPSREERRARFPLIAPVSSTSVAPLLQIATEWDFGKPELQKSLRSLKVDTRYVQPTDVTEVFAQFDDEDIVSLGPAYGGPFTLPINQGPFRYLNLWLGFSQASTSVQDAPQFVEPYILDFDIEGEPGDWPKDRATQIPPAT